MRTDDVVTCDYAVIGSGAGGATLAARLAEAGMNAGLSHLKIYELSEDLRKEGIVPSGLFELSAQGGF